MAETDCIRQVMNRPLRVLLWAPPGAGPHYDGGGMAAYRLYQQAHPEQLEVDLAHGYADHAVCDCYRAQHLIYPLCGRAVDQIRFIHAAKRWLAAHAHKYDIFHGLSGFEYTVRPAWYAERNGLPAVVKITNAVSNLSDKGGVRGFLRIAQRRRARIRKLSAVIAISQDIVAELRGYGIPDDKIARIPNGVDTEQFRPARDLAEKQRLREELGWRDVPTVIFSGAIVQRKRPHLLVDALVQLKREGVDCQLVLVGPEADAAYAEHMRSAAVEGGIAESVLWHGFTRDVAPLLRAADIFALPSSNEGMPNALLEAMASGIPSVVTMASGIPDLIADRTNGCIVLPDSKIIGQYITTYIKDSSLRNRHGVAARRTVVEGYSIEAILAAHEHLFRQILKD